MHPISRTLPILALLAACAGGDGNTDADGATDAVDSDDIYAGFIDITEESLGDFTGFDPTADWLVDTPNAAAQVDETLTLVIEDFETDDPVANANVDIWLSDVVTGLPDSTFGGDSSGNVAITVPVCTTLSYKVWTDPLLGETKETYEAHQIYGPGDTEPLNSVSSTTYVVIPSILGVNVDPAKGIIAGAAYDVNGDPIEGAQVLVRDSNGDIQTDVIVKYFIDDFPNRDQPYTSPDGLWVAINAPAGALTVELYGIVEGELVQLGGTELSSYADTINVSNIYTGYADGRKYPAVCL